MTDESASNPNNSGPKRNTGFKKGHPGYKPRGRHRATEIAERLSKGDLDEIVGVLAANSKNGCVQSAAILLNRAWPVPRGRLLRFPMPKLRNMADIAGALDGLLKAVADGLMTIPELILTLVIWLIFDGGKSAIVGIVSASEINGIQRSQPISEKDITKDVQVFGCNVFCRRNLCIKSESDECAGRKLLWCCFQERLLGESSQFMSILISKWRMHRQFSTFPPPEIDASTINNGSSFAPYIIHQDGYRDRDSRFYIRRDIASHEGFAMSLFPNLELSNLEYWWIREGQLITSDIGLFSHNSPLPISNNNSTYGAKGSDQCKPCGSIFKPMSSIMIGISLMGGGFWMIFFTARRRGLSAFSIGTALVLGGALVYFLGGIDMRCHLAENTSFVPYFCGASSVAIRLTFSETAWRTKAFSVAVFA
jgi:hypothetical protein